MIDLRSDTVTRPTPEMRQAMLEADVGDDVYHEDPTVNRLEEVAARMVGKDASVFVPSGTMGNEMALKTHTQPGHEMICHDLSHVVLYEMGGPSALSGLVTHTISTPDGLLRWEQIEKRVRGASDHYLGTGVIVVENTHNIAGGHVYPQEQLDEICDKAHERGIKVHMDGARVFNAAACLGRPAAELTAKVDSVMFCLSKGLGAPVGSMLAGSSEFIERARLARKLFGGSMRQAGVLAAPGLVALDQSPAGLPADHANAHYLAESLAGLPGIQINPAEVETNILIFDISGTGLNTGQLSASLKQKGVLANGIDERRMRMVTHYDVSRADCEQAIAVMSEVLSDTKAAVRG